MSTTPRVLQAETATLAVNRKDSLRASVATVKSLFAALPGLPSLTITRGPWFCPVMLLIIWAAILSAFAGALLAARGGSSPEVQQQLLTWEQACVLGIGSDTSLQETSADDATYRGSTPGLGKYRANDVLSAEHEITLADVVLAIGQPQWGCLDYGLHRGEPVIWMRLVFDDGQIEAFAPLSVNSQRLTPDMSTHILYCYVSGADYPVWQVGSWHGFTQVSAYQDCRYAGTAMPR